MCVNRYIVSILVIFLVSQAAPSYSQLGFSFDVKKPREYEERVLASEKSGQKKFSTPKRFIQNTVTHYNYFFNAKNKLNDVLERAKLSHRDDYSTLLPFYNYNLDNTAADSLQLDSVIYKATTGIVLHDLRNDWVDNLYLLWGAAYYLQKEYDSAYLTFQFINYAFAPKEKDGYYQYIGSRMDGNSALSISTKEKTNLPKKLLSEPPSRNDAFIWQIRTFIAREKYAEAGSLIATLRSDPAFPKRLQNDLEEVQSLLFYNQGMWDSAGAHLMLALDNATTKQEKARWEYLTGQLFEKAGRFEDAKKYYARAISHTTDPVMEIYARLNSIRINKSMGDEDVIDQNIALLVKMARRDKYQDYRDIIYFMAAQMEMERNNLEAAADYLMQGSQFTRNNNELRNKIYLQLGEMAFNQKKYRLAHTYYDSLKIDQGRSGGDELDSIQARKEMLALLAAEIDIIARQDSLQKIAALPEEERQEFVKALSKKLRKERGLEAESGLTAGSIPIARTPDLFHVQNIPKGDWYFYNSGLRSKGEVEFKSRWGNRPNVDNWRRISSVAVAFGQNPSGRGNPTAIGDTTQKEEASTEITYESLYENLPINEQKLERSNNRLQNALFALGKLYVEKVEDCENATQTLERLESTFPAFPQMDEVLFNLYYCYSSNGETAKANQIKQKMEKGFPDSRFSKIAITGKDPLDKGPDPKATKAYEDIYNLFIEGKFNEALAQKKKADSTYGKSYWSPQLLYLEAVYYIKQRQDSIATFTLLNLATQYPQHPLAAKANTLIDVLSRRSEIEAELSKIESKAPTVDTPSVQMPIQQPVTQKKDTLAVIKPVTKPTADTIAKKPTQTVITQPAIKTAFVFNGSEAHYAVVVLNKIDIVYGREAQNAFFRYNREKYYNQSLELTTSDIDPENKFLLIGPFASAQEAADYVKKAKPLAPREIVPWLKNDKYSFTVISDKNLDLLKENKDLENYKKFIEQQFPGQF